MAPNQRPIFSHPLISERAVDETRTLKVAYIGAGISGVVAAILLPKHVPGLDLTIYEKNGDVGGTWLENKYPGCACDIPAHAYQLSFESNVAWSKFYSGAPEILKYWQRVAEKYNVRRLIKFNHRCIEARWDESTFKWRTKIQNLVTGQTFEDISDVLITGQGLLNQWKWPDVKGLQDFKGKLMHSAEWDSSYDMKNKTIAVIGAGSSGIQIVPKLQQQVSRLDHYVRGKTWISTTFGHEIVRQHNDGYDGNFTHTPTELSEWASQPETYLAYRKSIEAAMLRGFIATHKGTPELQGATAFFEGDMRSRLAAKPEIASKLIPSFPPFCKRLTPGPGYLESLTCPNVSVIDNPISHITETGIATVDGTHRTVDAIVCATGFNTTFTNRIPIFGRDSTSISDRFTTDHPQSYLTISLDNFPNYFQALGPNSGLVGGNFVVVIECIHMYISQLLQKLSQTDVRTLEPKPSAVQTFTNFCEAFFERTVFSTECSSWFKSPRTPGGDPRSGRVTALWPGSGSHMMQALQRVRFEDFTVGHAAHQPSMSWLGNGFTMAELHDDPVEMVWYLAHGTNLVHEDLKPASNEQGSVVDDAADTVDGVVPVTNGARVHAHLHLDDDNTNDTCAGAVRQLETPRVEVSA